MNELKFRVWDKVIKNMREVVSIDFEKQEVICPPRGHEFSEWYNQHLPFNEVSILQYTGLKDKNGKEIYEGDILELGIQKGILKSVVEYHSPTFCHRWINLEEAGIRGKKIEPLFWNTNIIFEVIGNVYENPELLEAIK